MGEKKLAGFWINRSISFSKIVQREIFEKNKNKLAGVWIKEQISFSKSFTRKNLEENERKTVSQIFA